MRGRERDKENKMWRIDKGETEKAWRNFSERAGRKKREERARIRASENDEERERE